MTQHVGTRSMWALFATVGGQDEGAEEQPHSKSTLNNLAHCSISWQIEGVRNA